MQELALLDDSSTVYKLIGPAMIKQDLMEANTNVAKRLEYIQGEVKRITSKLTELEAKSKEQQQLVGLGPRSPWHAGPAACWGSCSGLGWRASWVALVAWCRLKLLLGLAAGCQLNHVHACAPALVLSQKGWVVALAKDSMATACCCCPPAAAPADCEVEIQAAAASTSGTNLLTRARSKLEAAVNV